MKLRKLLISSIFIMGIVGTTSAQDESYPAELDTESKRLSYTVGMDMGRSLEGLGVDLNLDLVIQGLRDFYTGNDTLLTAEQVNAIKQSFVQQRQQEMAAAALEKAQALAAENQAAGAAFLSENAEKEGVETTDSGLQYKVLEPGEGTSPDTNDRVTVHYTGTLIDGTVFDSSRERGEPTTFALNQVIPGWTEGLQLMQEGARYKFFIPAELAYGERGAGNTIEPGSTLIFDVELIAVEPVDAAADSALDAEAEVQ